MTYVPLYDDLGPDYDRFVNWEARLGFELPAIETLLAQHDVRRVLDTACGTGHHAIALAKRGYQVVGADLSAAMVTQARQNAAAAGVEVPFHQAGLGELDRHLDGPFDATLCLGHSLPHLPNLNAVQDALHDMAALLRPGGLLLLQNRNDERLLAQGKRVLPASSHREGEREWLFLRFLDLDPERIVFHFVTLWREERDDPWQQRVSSTVHRPIPLPDLQAGLHQAGFGAVAHYGSWNMEPYDPLESGDVVVVAQKGS